jgi:hypothetical protein
MRIFVAVGTECFCEVGTDFYILLRCTLGFVAHVLVGKNEGEEAIHVGLGIDASWQLY